MPAHFSSAKSQTSLQDSHDEVMLLLRLMALEGQVRVADGAAAAMPDVRTPAPSIWLGDSRELSLAALG